MEQRQSWHAISVDDALATLQSGKQGLDADESRQRLAMHGPNRLPMAKGPGIWLRFLRQFKSLLIYVLLGAAALSLALGHGLDAAVIMGVVLLNAAIGFVQEGRAERALEAIRAMIDPKASVLRAGQRYTLAAEEIVPGDIVLIEAGDRVPADLRLVRAHNLRIDEAALTGESVAVTKSTDPVAPGSGLGDRTSMAFSGTLVAAGQAAGVAVGTGADTELGRISTMMSSVVSLKTPLIRQMDQFARQLTIIILGIAAAVFLFAILARDYSVADGFMAVIGLSVAAIPEGLPATMTIALAIGVQRMAARNAIIRRLPAVETLGSVSVICTDKTGTLTRNEMTVRSLITMDHSYTVTGVGYAPDGMVLCDEREADSSDHPVMAELVRAGLLCNDAALRRTEAGWTVLGDPMEGALITLAEKLGLTPGLVTKQLPRTDQIPFDSVARYMATLHHSHSGETFILIKGAPERIVAMCGTQRTVNGDQPIDRELWNRRGDELAGRGERVLAFAVKPLQTERQTLTFDDVDNDATLLGFAGFIDPPRDEATAAVADCRSAGIQVVMITGDHAVTAGEIARQVGLSDAPAVMTGDELEALDDAGVRAAVRTTTVFARTTPEHKLRLVAALQAEGLTAAMTGDGVNDAPALKRADVGVAMGHKGTEAAKEAAEMVLADDNFASIVSAVREGRTVYDNLTKVIAWTLPTSVGEAMTILAAIGFGLALPITPVQILWVNMITAVALGLALAFEPTEPGTMQRRPRPAGTAILSGELVWRISFVSALFVTGAFGMFFWAIDRDLPIETARTLVVNTLVVFEIFYLFSIRFVHGTSLTWRGILGTPAVLIGVGVSVFGQLLFTYAPFMQTVFATSPVTLLDGLTVIGSGVILLVFVESEKALRRAIRRRRD